MKRLSVLITIGLFIFSFGCGGSSKPAIGVALSPSAALTIVQGQQANLSAAVSNDSKNQGVTWSLSGTGCTGSTCGTLTNVTTTSVTYNAPASVSSKLTVTVTATAVADAAKSTSVTISIVPPPSVMTTSLPDGLQNAAYTATTLAASGGLTPYTWSITAGSLPAGMTISSSGVISGTPTGAGTANFTVQVTDSSSPGLKATKALSVLVNPPPPLSITNVSLPNGVQGSAYSATPLATGGTLPYSWSVVAGSLPAGLTIHAATGVIDGTPTTAGTSTFTVQVADSTTPALTSTKVFSIVIAPPPLTITTTTLPGGTVNSIYAATTLATSGGTPPVTWSVTTGTVPTGLTLHPTGVIDGTPTASGTFNFTVTATDSASTPQVKTQALSIVIAPALTITTASLPDGAMNTAYSATLASSDGTAPVTWSVSSGTLPAGLTLNSGTGAISGTPTVTGKANFTVQATDHSNPPATPQKALSITVVATPLVITTTTLPGGTANSTYAPTTLATTGGTPPITWSVTAGAMPAGLTLHTSGLIDGVPAASGTFGFTVTATDSDTTPQVKTKQLSIVVSPALSITTNSLPDGAVNTAYGATLTSSGGIAPVTWSVSVGVLPAGLTLNSSTGAISGTPTAAGQVDFTVEATDHSTPPQTPEVALSITVAPSPFVISTSTLANATIGTAYNATLQATGGTPPISWSVTAGALPSGLTLHSTTGVIDGTPTGSPATTNFTVTASDSGSPVQNKTQALSILTVSGGANNAELNGHYAFALRGFDSTNGGLVTIAGSFVADGKGNVTGGVEDINTTSSINTDLAITGGFYSVGADQRGTLTLTTSQGNSTFDLVLGSITSGVSSVGHMIGSDSRMVAGDLKKQDTSAFSTASISGNYAFGLGGVSPRGGRFAIAGVVRLDGAGNFSMTMDVNDGGSVDTETCTGTYTVSDTVNGRAILNNTTNGSQSAMYLVSATEIFFIDIDGYSHGPLLTGSALKQSGTFSNSSMNGTKSVFMAQSVSSYSGGVPSAAYAGVGLFSWTTTGAMTAEIDENDGGTVTHTTGISGTYTVASNGRMTITVGGSPMPQVFYLASPGKAFSVGTNGAVSEGQLKPQSGSWIANGSLSGNFGVGTLPPVMSSSDIYVGALTLDVSGLISGTIYQNSGGITTTLPYEESYFALSANGRVELTDSVMYFITTSKGVMLSSGAVDPVIHMMDQ